MSAFVLIDLLIELLKFARRHKVQVVLLVSMQQTRRVSILMGQCYGANTNRYSFKSSNNHRSLAASRPPCAPHVISFALGAEVDALHDLNVGWNAVHRFEIVSSFYNGRCRCWEGYETAEFEFYVAIVVWRYICLTLQYI